MGNRHILQLIMVGSIYYLENDYEPQAFFVILAVPTARKAAKSSTPHVVVQGLGFNGAKGELGKKDASHLMLVLLNQTWWKYYDTFPSGMSDHFTGMFCSRGIAFRKKVLRRQEPVPYYIHYAQGRGFRV